MKNDLIQIRMWLDTIPQLDKSLAKLYYKNLSECAQSNMDLLDHKDNLKIEYADIITEIDRRIHEN